LPVYVYARSVALLADSGTALVISGVALGVSLATFLWRIVYDIYWDAPRLRVTLDKVHMTGYQGPQGEAYHVIATNTGRRPTTLTEPWLAFGHRPRWWWRFARRLLTRGVHLLGSGR